MARGDEDKGLAAAVIAGWIEAEAPDYAQTELFDTLNVGLARPDATPATLWLDLAGTLERLFCRDGAASAFQAAVTMLPGQPYLRYRLARALHLAGDPRAAWQALAPLTAMGTADPAQIQLRLELAQAGAGDRDEALALLEAWIKTHPRWEAAHAGLLKTVASLGETERLARLVQGLKEAENPAIEATVGLARARLDAGDTVGAKALFTRLSALGLAWLDLVVGTFSGPLPPYDEAVERRIQERILSAAALSDTPPALAPCPPADMLGGKRILLAGYQRADHPNDMVHHLLTAAHQSGLEATAWLDDALTMGVHLKISDAAIAARLDAFEAELASRRPDLLLLDWVTPITRRGMTPERMKALKDRLGFRLVVSMRDGHGGATPTILAWADVADAVILYHPLAPALTEAPQRLRSRLLVLWVPVQAQPFRPWAERSMTLAFAGSTAFTLRNALLSVLLSEDLPFRAVIGAERRQRLSTMADYLGFLGDTRAMLNISAHTHDEHLVTGRVWEAAACQTLLVEQENPATAHYFTPWRHYLPWRNAADIAHFAHFTTRHPDMARMVAVQASERVARYFTPQRLWATILARAFTPPLP